MHTFASQQAPDCIGVVDPCSTPETDSDTTSTISHAKLIENSCHVRLHVFKNYWMQNSIVLQSGQADFGRTK